MRIISGRYGGRRFTPPTKMPARPTTDVAKEGLFNVLQNYIDLDGSKTLDLYAGTGNISYELASRGAEHLTLVEKSRKMINYIKSNMEKLHIDEELRLCQDDVFTFLNYDKGAYDFIFAGPPYADKKIDKLPDRITQGRFIAPEGIFVLEHTPRNDFENHPHFKRLLKYGTTLFSLFENQ